MGGEPSGELAIARAIAPVEIALRLDRAEQQGVLQRADLVIGLGPAGDTLQAEDAAIAQRLARLEDRGKVGFT